MIKLSVLRYCWQSLTLVVVSRFVIHHQTIDVLVHPEFKMLIEFCHTFIMYERLLTQDQGLVLLV